MQFDFGQNWLDFSEIALTEKKVEQSKIHFYKLIGDIDFLNKTFLDIGFGQGLSLLNATELGALTYGLDINLKCKETLLKNKERFYKTLEKSPKVEVGSILNTRTTIFDNMTFDIVHSWGVLHHTGEMYLAIDNACKLVNDEGHFILSIYNKHWTSPIWVMIKYLYNISPKILKKLFFIFFYFIILIAKALVTGKNPFKMERGMSFKFDVIDWIGGYPYEYASKSEIERFLNKRKFKLVNYIPAKVPTGCNEFIFKKI